MTDSRVLNCRFAFNCSQQWADLKAIADTPTARYCVECQTAVHLCGNATEVEWHARQGHCVAVRERPELPDLVMGVVVLPYDAPVDNADPNVDSHR